MTDLLVNPPPLVKIFDYPGATGVAIAVALTTVMLVVAGRFDPTQGALTISILIVLGMLGACA